MTEAERGRPGSADDEAKPGAADEGPRPEGVDQEPAREAAEAPTPQAADDGQEPEAADPEPSIVAPDPEPAPDAAGEKPSIESADPGSADAAPIDSERRTSLAMARLHLRMGALALARAELESFAGAGMLDEAALVDLAEARWRTGDLAGAGEAADVALGRGVENPLAIIIAAEAVAADGRPAEARRLAERALRGFDGSLEPVFAGMPRSVVWPTDALLVEDEAEGDLVDRTPASAAAAEAFAGGRGALAAGDTTTAALRLSIAIRLEPKFAQGVLASIGDRRSVPQLALVAGDALRLLGRDDEALEAYDRARGKAPAEEAEASAPDWPEADEG